MVPIDVIKTVVDINIECFTSDDTYSDIDYVKSLLKRNCGLLTVSLEGEIVGYILYAEYPTHMESLRRALTRKARGKGLGMKLTKKLIAVANRKKKDIFTYVSKSNLPSLNSNLRCGYLIDAYGDKDFVYITHKYRGK